MELDSLIESAAANGASDLHLEAGMPAALRIRGTLRTTGEPVAPRSLAEIARSLIGEEQWPVFLERRSFDMSRTIRGVRCRINIFQTARGVGLAIRLLSAFQATVEKLNLHPDLKKLVKHPHGLILVSGPTGCGKSSTMAALIQEINLTETQHIITVESPIEYSFRPRRAFIRQRTPRMVRDMSNERRSTNTGHCSSPMSKRAKSASGRGAMGAPATRNVPRTRNAAGIPASRCRSLAPLLAANSIIESSSI